VQSLHQQFHYQNYKIFSKMESLEARLSALQVEKPYSPGSMPAPLPKTDLMASTESLISELRSIGMNIDENGPDDDGGDDDGDRSSDEDYDDNRPKKGKKSTKRRRSSDGLKSASNGNLKNFHYYFTIFDNLTVFFR